LNERQRIADWVRWFEISVQGYQANALLAILRSDGEKMLLAVLKELKLTDSVSLLKEMDKRDRQAT
jgi:hypothetical protein